MPLSQPQTEVVTHAKIFHSTKDLRINSSLAWGRLSKFGKEAYCH